MVFELPNGICVIKDGTQKKGIEIGQEEKRSSSRVVEGRSSHIKIDGEG
jgi:hypothetical protein